MTSGMEQSQRRFLRIYAISPRIALCRRAWSLQPRDARTLRLLSASTIIAGDAMLDGFAALRMSRQHAIRPESLRESVHPMR